MKFRFIALFGALAMLLTIFTACGNGGGTQTGGKPQQNDPQLVIAANPVFEYDDDSFSLAYNDLNGAMSADSQSSSLTAITDSAWTWAYDDGDGWVERAVYGFGRWKNGAGAQAKGVYAYSYAENGNTSLGVYTAKANELVTYQDESVPDSGILLSAVTGAEESLCYTVKQDGTMTIPAGTFTAIEQVAGVKTGFLAEDGTARSASVRIIVNSAQLYSGTLCNSTAAEDGVAVTQLSYPQIDNIPVKAGDTVIIAIKLDAQANSDEDVTAPTVNEEDNWQVVRKSKQVLVEDATLQESDVTTADGAIKTISNYQFTFTLVRDEKYTSTVAEFAKTIMKRTGAEVFTSRPGKETKYEIVLGVCADRPESKRIYDEIVGARADNAADYILRLVGTKLYIIGVNDDAMQAAMDYFLETFVKDDKGAVPAKYNHYYKPAHVTYTIAGQNIASYTIRTERYPSVVLQKAAEAIQEAVLNDCGYIIPIKVLNIEGTDLGNNEIRIGPMQGSVKIHRDWDYHKSEGKNTRFKVSNWTEYMSIDEDGWLDSGYGDWTVNVSGKNVVIQGGAAYSANVGVMRFLSDLKKSKAIAASYTANGDYVSYYDWENLYEYETVEYSMAEGYGLTWQENFDYTGTDKQIEKEVYKKWDFSTKTDYPDISLEMMAVHPRKYGENWWIAADTAGNGYLFEISRKRTLEHEGTDQGWEAVRIHTEGKMGFRYGIWEQRMIMGCHNGASSSMWCATSAPYNTQGPWLEFDIYENYSREIFVPCTHHFVDSEYLGNYHFQAPYYQEKCWIEPNEGEHYYDTFHHFAVEWNYDFAGFYLDGKCVSAMPMTNYDDFKYYRTGVVIRTSIGAGALNYSATMPEGVERNTTYVPKYWIGEENLHKYFEVLMVDHSRIYQTSNEGIDNPQAESEMKFTSRYGRY